MYSTYHFKNAEDIDTDILNTIKTAFKGKPIVLTVEEDQKDELIPDWHKKIVYQRLAEIDQKPDMLLSEEKFMQKLKHLKK